MPNKIADDSTCSVYDLKKTKEQLEKCIKLKIYLKSVNGKKFYFFDIEKFGIRNFLIISQNKI